jgi:hypothetical protein
MDVTLLHRGLEDAGRIINGVFRVPVASDKTSGPFSLVPPYVDLPMEEVYPLKQGRNVPRYSVIPLEREGLCISLVILTVDSGNI